MARARRQAERFLFAPPTPAPVLEAMARITDGGDGWLNVVPLGHEGEEEPATRLRAFPLFSGGSSGMTMATWVLSADARTGTRRASLGIAHLAGRRVAGTLADAGVPVPAGWAIEQDHPRRGLVLNVPVGEAHEAVLSFAIAALTALARQPIARWRAEVHLARAT